MLHYFVVVEVIFNVTHNFTEVANYLTDPVERNLSQEANSRSAFQETFTFYETRNVTTLFTRFRHWFLS